jgi:hypothetical protein
MLFWTPVGSIRPVRGPMHTPIVRTIRALILGAIIAAALMYLFPGAFGARPLY